MGIFGRIYGCMDVDELYGNIWDAKHSKLISLIESKELKYVFAPICGSLFVKHHTNNYMKLYEDPLVSDHL